MQNKIRSADLAIGYWRSAIAAFKSQISNLRSRDAIVALPRCARLLVFLLVSAMAIATVGCNRSNSGDPTHASAKAQKYHCPMHPNYVSDRPGDCPICNMKLVPIKEDKPIAPAASTALTQAKVGQYYCPMDPEVVSNAPGICPECNMKLELLTEEKLKVAQAKHAAHAQAPTVPGRIAIVLSPEKQQMIGLRFSDVEKRNLTLPVRTTATIEHDETRLAKIAPRFSGWVKDLKINYTGQEVEKGEPLLTVYSPDLLSAENEYLIAYQRLKQLPANSPEAESARRLVESSRRKLSLWQIGDEEIRALEQSGQPKDELLLRSPVSGHVIAKTAIEGKAFMAGETLYEIADLSRVWLRAAVYEYELPLIKIGQKARITLPYLGNKTYESTVTFLYPHIEQQTRRAEIRLELDNPNHELRPQMWANVDLNASFGETLAVPASAVIDTGERYVAFVQRPDEHLEPREVKIGLKTADYFQVMEGVNEGEKVVTRALFLVDSESQLKAAIAGMGAAGEHKH